MTNTQEQRSARTKETLALSWTGVAAILIAVGSFWPEAGQGGPPGSDKVRHAFAFAALVFPVALWSTRHLTWLAPAALFYGAAIEVIQPYFGRGAEWLDLLADVIGIAAAIWLARLLPSRWRG